ncbi:MAG: hypothetical protein WB676_27770 [Bryobacteraceae bacterium]
MRKFVDGRLNKRVALFCVMSMTSVHANQAGVPSGSNTSPKTARNRPAKDSGTFHGYGTREVFVWSNGPITHGWSQRHV